MSILIRLLTIFAATAAFALLLGAAARVGRSLPALLAVVQIAEFRPEIVSYGLVDVDRAISTRRSIAVRGYAGARFAHDPPLILQLDFSDGRVLWTLSRLDPLTGALTAEMRFDTHPSQQVDIDWFRRHPGGRWVYHTIDGGDLYYTDAGGIDARLVGSVPVSAVAWSSDSSRVAIEFPGGVQLESIDGSPPVTIPIPAMPLVDVRWSPDDRHIVIASPGHMDGAMLVADADTGEVVARLEGRMPRWCGGRLLYIAGADAVEARLYDGATGAERVVLTRELSDQPLSRRPLTVLPVQDDSCEWLLALGGQRAELVHLASGQAIPLGDDTALRSYDVDSGAFTYVLATSATTEIRRVALDPSVDGYDVLISVDRLSTSLTWLDAERGGLYLQIDRLMRVDANTGAEYPVAGPGIQAFHILP